MSTPVICDMFKPGDLIEVIDDTILFALDGWEIKIRLKGSMICTYLEESKSGRHCRTSSGAAAAFDGALIQTPDGTFFVRQNRIRHVLREPVSRRRQAT